MSMMVGYRQPKTVVKSTIRRRSRRREPRRILVAPVIHPLRLRPFIRCPWKHHRPACAIAKLARHALRSRVRVVLSPRQRCIDVNHDLRRRVHRLIMRMNSNVFSVSPSGSRGGASMNDSSGTTPWLRHFSTASKV